MADELKPCPFCGEEVDYQDMGSDRVTVFCKKCQVTLGQTWGVNGNRDKLAREWNTRPAERAVYLKALDDARKIVEAEFDRWLEDKDDEYPTFDNIYDGFDRLKSAYKEGEHAD